MEAMNEMDMMKDGARRVQAFLEAKGIDVKHNVMLEALSAGFGSRNWRTVRDKLNGPAENQAVAYPPVDPERRWHVFGEYTDNRQLYHAYYPGHCAQEAAVHAQIERMFDEYGAHFSPGYAEDCAARPETPTYQCDSIDYACGGHSEALRHFIVLAEKCLRKREVNQGVGEARVLLQLAESAVDDDEFCDDLDELDKWTREQKGFGDEAAYKFTYNNQYGTVLLNLTGKQVFEALCDIVTDEDLENLEDETKTQVYQVRALLKYASSEVSWLFSQYEL